MLDAWAVIKSRQSRPEGGFGRWRLTPPGMGGYRLRVGTPHPPPAGAPSAVHTPSVYPKGTCFAARTGVPSRGRLTRTCPLMI